MILHTARTHACRCRFTVLLFSSQAPPIGCTLQFFGNLTCRLALLLVPLPSHASIWQSVAERHRSGEACNNGELTSSYCPGPRRCFCLRACWPSLLVLCQIDPATSERCACEKTIATDMVPLWTHPITRCLQPSLLLLALPTSHASTLFAHSVPDDRCMCHGRNNAIGASLTELIAAGGRLGHAVQILVDAFNRFSPGLTSWNKFAFLSIPSRCLDLVNFPHANSPSVNVSSRPATSSLFFSASKLRTQAPKRFALSVAFVSYYYDIWSLSRPTLLDTPCSPFDLH